MYSMELQFMSYSYILFLAKKHLCAILSEYSIYGAGGDTILKKVSIIYRIG